ncbi:MAG TPA: hypothetical protein VGA21_02445 [Cyclobacteriaceae bacterium]|jgi:hypothetical protein
MQGFLRKSAGEKSFSTKICADLREKIFLIPLISQITTERIYSNQRRSAEEKFFNPADIVDHRTENLFRDFCANPRNLREKRVFLRKSAPTAEEEFLIPLVSRITAEKWSSEASM